MAKSTTKNTNDDWKSALQRPPRGKAVVQMPMHVYSYAEWRYRRRTPRAGSRCLGRSQQAVIQTGEPEQESAMQKVSMLFPDADQLIADAVRDHIIHYSVLANEEAGFDLGILRQ